MFFPSIIFAFFSGLLGICGSEDTVCGNAIYGESGEIDFNGSSTLDTDECIWTIHTPDNSKVTAKILECHLPAIAIKGSDVMSYIEIRDGDSCDDTLIGNYTYFACSALTDQIDIGYSSTNSMWVRVYAPVDIMSGVYFTLNFTACGGSVEGMAGTVSSPFYPDSYLKEGVCTWTIETPQGMVIESSFPHFNMRYNEDYVELRNEINMVVPDIGRFTQHNYSANIDDSTSNTMWATFRALNLSYTGRNGPHSFKLDFEAIGGKGGDIFASEGVIYSPGHPSRDYPREEAFYVWNVYCPSGTFVCGKFVDFWVDTNDCVHVFDGDSLNLIQECRHKEDCAEEFHTTGNKMVVHLSTSSDNKYGRFELAFEANLTETTQDIYGYNGSVFSPMYPYSYPMDIIYTTNILTPNRTKIKLEFIEFELRKGDNVSVFDSNGEMLAVYYFDDYPEVLYTQSNFSSLVLFSNVNANTLAGGYHLEFSALPENACPSPDDKNADLYPEKTFYIPGDALALICHEGYDISTNYTNITCESDGSWNEDIPECIAVSCGDPGQVDNGGSEGNDFTYGSNVTYLCHEGYILNGTSTITCLSNGTWSADLPVCIIVSCTDPGNLENGDKVGDDYAYGSNVSYECHEGYDIEGSETITCQSDGTWNGDTPDCIIVSCGDPGETENGYSEGDDFTYGNNVTYQCHEGYYINGSGTITCQGSGLWDGEVPECTRVDCGEPDDIENGEKSGDDSYLYEDVIFYECNEGYSPVNNLTFTICQASGDWSELPSCVATESAGVGIKVGAIVFIVVLLLVITTGIVIFVTRSRSSKSHGQNDGEKVQHELSVMSMSNTGPGDGIDDLNNTKNNGQPSDSSNFHSELDGSALKGAMFGVKLNSGDGSVTEDSANGSIKMNAEGHATRFVYNDIYEPGDDKLVAKQERIPGVNHQQEKAVAEKKVNQTSGNNFSGMKENAFYESADMTDRTGGFNLYDEADEQRTNASDSKGVVNEWRQDGKHGHKLFAKQQNPEFPHQNGIVNDNFQHDYDNLGDNKLLGIKVPQTGIVDNDVYESADDPPLRAEVSFTDNILYEESHDSGLDNVPPSSLQAEGFVDNDIYEDGDCGSPSRFTDNILYEFTEDENPDDPKVCYEDDVYYSTIDKDDHDTGFKDNVAYGLD